jgi:hypothetical protein
MMTLGSLEAAIRKFEQMRQDALANGDNERAQFLKEDIRLFKRIYRRIQKGENLDE